MATTRNGKAGKKKSGKKPGRPAAAAKPVPHRLRHLASGPRVDDGRRNVRVVGPSPAALPESGLAKAFTRLRRLRARRVNAKQREMDLVKHRKALDQEIPALGPQEKKKKQSLKAEWHDVVHDIDLFRALQRSLADAIDQTIEDADQGKFDFAEDADPEEPPSLFAGAIREPGDDIREAAAEDEEAAVGNPPARAVKPEDGIPIERLADMGVSDRAVAALKRGGFLTVQGLVNRDLSKVGRLTLVHGVSPNDEHAIELAVERIKAGQEPGAAPAEAAAS